MKNKNLSYLKKTLHIEKYRKSVYINSFTNKALLNSVARFIAVTLWSQVSYLLHNNTMATKLAGKLARSHKKSQKHSQFTPYLKTTIPANQAKPAPPLGPQLGQVGDTEGTTSTVL